MFTRILILLILTSYYTTTCAQFSLKTEYAYLTHVNTQKNKSLITDNLRNAEMVLQGIRFTKPDSANMQAHFYLALANSHYLLNNYENTLYLILEQRCVFPFPSADEFSYKLFKKAGYKLKIPAKKLNTLFTCSATENQPADIVKQHQNAIECQIKLNQKALDEAICSHIEALQNFSTKATQHATQQWQFYKQIKLKHKEILPVLDFSAQKIDSAEFYTIENVDLMLKILKKAVRYYTKRLDFEPAQCALTYTAAVYKDKNQLRKYKCIQKYYYRKQKKVAP